MGGQWKQQNEQLLHMQKTHREELACVQARSKAYSTQIRCCVNGFVQGGAVGPRTVALPMLRAPHNPQTGAVLVRPGLAVAVVHHSQTLGRLSGSGAWLHIVTRSRSAAGRSSSSAARWLTAAELVRASSRAIVSQQQSGNGLLPAWTHTCRSASNGMSVG
eukprot:126355-Chlamydomonas_euryale.AAC.2